MLGQALQKRIAAAQKPLKIKVDIESAYPAQPEQAGLNLRPKSIVSGWPSKNFISALA